MSQIIISYNKDDTQTAAIQLNHYLGERFGAHAVTMGANNLVQVGEVDAEAVEKRVKQAEILLILIGNHWLDGDWINEAENPDRLAMVTAFANNKRALPVLVDGAAMPSLEQLPNDLSPLVRRKPIQLRDETFQADAMRLASALEDFIPLYYTDPIAVKGTSSSNSIDDRYVSDDRYAYANYAFAGTGTRLIAYFIDNFIQSLIAYVIGTVVGSVLAPSIQVRTFEELRAAQTNLAIVGVFIGFAVYFLYLTYFWTRSGQTPGKRMMGIRVIHQDGRLLTTREAIIRALGYYANAFVFGLGFLMILFDVKKQGWHDKMAGSFVVRIENKKR